MRNFVPNIDDVNNQIRLLEAKLGLPSSEFIDRIDEANARLEELQSRAKASPSKSDGKPSSMSVATRSTVVSAPLRVVGLERAIAARRGQKTHMDIRTVPLFGLARAIAANTPPKRP